MMRRGSLKHLLQWLIAGTRGGANRARIISAIHDEPRNANQLSSFLALDYRTIRHHLDLLKKNGLITSIGEAYGTMYFLSRELEDNYSVFEEIGNRMETTLKRKDEE